MISDRSFCRVYWNGSRLPAVDKENEMRNVIAWGTLCCVAACCLVASTRADEPASEDFQRRYESSLGFAIDVFQYAAANAKPDENVLVSPLSLCRSLGAAALGADGKTRKELDAFLERAVGADDWSAQSASVFNALKSGDELTAVGGVWIQKGYDVQDSYLKRLRAFSDMEAFVVDLKESTINRWFDEKTGGRVQNAVKGIKSNTRVVIGDAITFLGKWERSFDPAGTKERPFTEIDGKRVLVPTMIQKENFRYCQKGGVQYVELDYRDGRYTMAIVVPDANMTYQNLENVLNADEVVDWRRSSRSTEMMLSMPKFAAKFDVDMNPVLKKMGVRDAFDRDAADFSAMAANGAKRGDDALYVDQVLQSATIKVNEEGTEAAAATGVLLGAMGLPSYVNLTIDRPFVYFIRENTTGQVVFIGRTVKPTFDPDDPEMKTPEVEPGSRVMPMGMGGMSGGIGGMGIVPGAGM